MDEGENSWTVNSKHRNCQTAGQDEVLLVVGEWVKVDKFAWTFEPETVAGKTFIRLRPSMTLQELRRKVREKLGLRAHNITIKMSYQYPSWMAVDDGNGSPPQYIIEDGDVEVFIQMRRHIEEVNLFVSVMKHQNEVPPLALTTQKFTLNYMSGDSADESGYESDDEWHEFALEAEEVPETQPRSTDGRSVPARGVGVIIRDPEPIIRLNSEGCRAADKGKGVANKAVEEGGDESDSKSEEGDFRIVPFSQPTIAEVGGGSDVGVREGVDSSRVGVGSPQQHHISIADNDGGETEPQRDHISFWGRAHEALNDILTDFSDDPALFCRDAPPVFNDGKGEGVDSAFYDIKYEGDKLFVGRVFKSKADCKIKLAIHAINRKFHFRTSRSTPLFMVLKCISPTCPWRVYASKIDSSSRFQIRQATQNHTCSIDQRRRYHRLATTQVIGELMQSRFLGIKRGPNASVIRKFLLDDFHVSISYWKAWRAREVAMEKCLGSMAGSYALIPAYTALLQQANPGSLCFTEYEEVPEGPRRFKYQFIAFAASIKGYSFMRKVIVVDGTTMKGRYGGCLISACCQDGNFQVFPLAFGIVNSENDAAYEWFFSRLSIIAPDSSQLLFISDRHASIYRALSKVYPQAHHAVCVVHLWRNIQHQFKPHTLAGLMTAAAQAFHINDFSRLFLQIQKLNPGCAAYLVNLGFTEWTRVHSRGKRYNIMDSNICESWNNVLREAREYPIICMLEYIRTTLMDWFATRRAAASRCTTTVAPSVYAKIQENFELAMSLVVRAISNFDFQVQASSGEYFTVKMSESTCSCMEFQSLGFPCAHAIAAASHLGVPTDSLVAAHYLTDCLKASYDEKIYPIHSVGGEVPPEDAAGTSTQLYPPAVRRPPGRPRKIRILSRGEFKRKRPMCRRRCSRCGLVGHNKASCKNPI